MINHGVEAKLVFTKPHSREPPAIPTALVPAN
jgi:hypothetical protein